LGQLVEEAAGVVAFEGRPGVGEASLAGQEGGGERVGGARAGGDGAFQSAGGDQPSALVAAGCPVQVREGLGVLPLGVRVGRQVVVALGGVGVLLAAGLAADVQGVLQVR